MAEKQRPTSDEFEDDLYMANWIQQRGLIKSGDTIIPSADGVTTFPGFQDDPGILARMDERLKEVFGDSTPDQQ